MSNVQTDRPSPFRSIANGLTRLCDKGYGIVSKYPTVSNLFTAGVVGLFAGPSAGGATMASLGMIGVMGDIATRRDTKKNTALTMTGIGIYAIAKTLSM